MYVGEQTLMTINVNNPNSGTALTGVSWSDTLPTGLSYNGDSGPDPVCGGSLTKSGNVMTLTGATIAPLDGCNISVAVIANGAATGLITNSTTAVTSTNGGTGNSASAQITVNPVPDLSISDVSQAEGNGPGTTTMSFTVTRSGDLSGTSTVNYSTTAGTATQGSCGTPGNDYQSASGLLTFVPTDASETITVTICGDTTPEPDETFTVNLATPSNATISDATGDGTIQNDDGSVTYTWNPTSVQALALCSALSNQWICPGNWTPLRPTASSASTTDILIFDGTVTPSPTILNVPTQTNAAIQFKNNINEAKFEATLGAATLTFNGNTGSDFAILTGSALRLQGSNAITIALTAAGQEGIISGSLIFQGAAHQLTGANAGEIVFFNASIFTTTTGFSGHPFGSGTDGSVVFDGGSSAFFGAGADPFGGAGKNIVSFGLSPMSNQEFSAASAFDSNGRSYGNLTLTGSSQAYSGSGTGLFAVFGNFVLGNTSTLTLSSSSGGNMVVNGNWTDNNNSATAFDANSRTVTFSGAALTQTISKSGAETFDDFAIAKTGGSVLINNAVTIDGQLLFNGTVDVLDIANGTLTLNGTVGGTNAAGGLKGQVPSSTLIIGGTGALGTLRFVSGGEYLTSFTVNRTSSGSVTLGTNLNIGDATLGGVNLTNGIVDMGSNTLSLAEFPSMNATNGYVIGNVKKTFGATGTFNFAVGTANGYSPVGVNVTGNSFPASLMVKAVQGPHPNITGANALQRYWTLTETGDLLADVTFNWLASDVTGTENSYKIFKYNGSFEQIEPDVLNTTSHFATKNGLSDFSDWTLAEPAAVEEGTLAFSETNYDDNETNADHSSVAITVNRTGGTDGAVSVQWATSTNTATAGTDYVEASGTLNWADGEGDAKTFNVTVKGDTDVEPDELVNLTLSLPTGGATIGGTNPATLTIQNDDAAPTNPSGVGAANPSSVAQGGTTELTVTVTPGTNPTSTNLMVSGDLSAIGGSLTQQFFDDGTNGDDNAGDNVFTYDATVTLATTPGAKNLPITITDAMNRIGNSTIALTVTAAPTDTDVTLSAGNLLIEDTGGDTDDTLTISLDGANIRISDPNHTLNCAAPTTQDGPNSCLVSAASVTTITVDTNGGDDSLTVATAGDPIPSGGLTYNGGDQGNGGDKLVITGNGQGTVTYNYTNANDGNIVMSNFGTVTYTGLEPITNSGTATDVIFNLPTGGNSASLEDDGTAANGMSRLRSVSATFETTDFANPTNSLTINAGDLLSDSITVEALPDFNKTLTIGSTSNLFNSITMADDVTVTGTISLNAGEVTGSGDLSTSAGLTVYSLSPFSALSGVISGDGGLTADGFSILTLSGTNTYTGPTVIQGGAILSVSLIANGGVASNIGQSTNVATNLVLSSGVLEYTGGGADTDRLFTVQTDGEIDNNGSGGLNFTNTGSINAGSSAATLVVCGGYTGENTFSPTIPDPSTDSLSLIAESLGTYNLEGANTYTGTTGVESGRLNINGSIASNTTVDFPGTLGGTGTINGTVTAQEGVVAPGLSPGILNTGNVTLDADSTLEIEIGGTTPGNLATNHDQLNVTGTVDVGGATLDVDPFNGYAPVGGETFVILINDDPEAITGEFAGLTEGATIPNFLGATGVTATITYKYPGGTGNDVALTTTAAAACGPQSTVYVDDDWVGTTPGADPDAGAGPATNFGCDSFATIQEGIDGVASGGTVIVYAGTYTQATSINLNKSLTLRGPNFAISPNGGARVAEALVTGAPTTVLRISAPGTPVTIEGFKFDSAGVIDAYDPALDITIKKNIFSNGISGGALYFLNAPTQLTIDDNLLTNAVVADNDTVFVAGNWNGTTGTVATITNNVIENTPTDNASGMNLSNVSGTVTGNQFKKLRYYAILLANNSSSITISGNLFDGMVNPDPGNVPTWGAGVRTYTPSFTGPVNITGNTFVNNYTGVGIRGVPNDPSADITGMDINVNFNRFVGNTYGISDGAAGTLDAENNWWGCNFGPGTGGAGCTGTPNGILNTGSGAVDADPWIVLQVSASPTSLTPGGTSTISADMTENSAGANPAGTLPDIPDSWTATNGTMNPTADFIVAGADSSQFTSTNGSNGQACVTVDGQQECTSLTVTAPSFSIDSVAMSEGNAGPTNFVFTVTKTGTTSLNSSVTFTTADNTAKVSDSDYASNTNTLIFAAADTQMQITVQITGDTKLEPDETFFVDLSSPVNATISQSRGVGTIQNDDGAPSFSIADVTMAEGDAGTTNFVFTVTKTGATGERSRVDFATAAGVTNPATSGGACGGSVDYITQTGTLQFLPADATKTITVPVCTNTIYELDETFFVNLSNAGNATISDNQALGTITNDDTCGPQATVYVDDNWAGTAIGDDPDAGGPATSFGCDAFDTIQGGVNGVAVGGTVIVYAGTYNEDVNINKAGLNVLGAGAASTNVVGPSGGPGTTIQISASNVTVAGFTITRAGNTVATWNDPLNTAGIAIQGTSITGALIRDNVITGNRTGIDINNSNDHTIRNNVIDFNRTGLIFRNQTDSLTVTENFITNNWTVGIVFLDGSGGTNIPSNQALSSVFFNNNISANWYGQVVERQTGGSLPAPGTTNFKDFRGNWWGTTSPVVTTANSAEPGYAAQIPVAYGGTATPPGGQPDIAGPASANIRYLPLLQSGTDTNVETTPGRGTNGFQGVGVGNIIVRSNKLEGWVPQTSGTATTDFVVGPATPPLGEGSGQLSVGANGASGAQFRQTTYNGTLLSDLTKLTYSTYTSNDGSAPMTGDQTIYIILNVDLDGDGDFDGSDTLLFFEPEYQHGYTGTVPDQGDNVLNTWQTWDALAGGWWSTTGAAGANPGASVKPLSTIIAAFPNARIHNSATTGSLRVVAGFGAGSWDNFVGNVDNVNVGVNTANLTYDFEPLPRISIDDVTLNEGNAGPTSYTFNVTLSGPGDQTITVNYQTADDTATTADSDYTGVASTGITFNPGETSKPVTIFVNGDTKFETTEQFFVNLSGAVNATILDGQGVGTITNDDTQPTISIDDVTAFEGDSGTTDFNFTVSLSNASYLPITVTAQTANGSATTADADYNAVGATVLTFSPNTTTQPFQVQANGDTKYELDETFFVNLSLPTNATLADGQGTGTITNDDAAPSVSINDLTATEGTGLPATKQFNFTVTKSGSTSEPATVTFQTADDTGGANPATSGASCSTPGVDYIPNSGTVIFPAAGPGSTSQTVTILVCRDSAFEPHETFLVSLSGAVNAAISDGQAVGTITNDDVPAGGFVVNTTADTIDDNLCLPIGSGNGCTLREAINAANASPAATAINFAIPDNDARHFYYKDDGVANQVTNDLAHVLVTTAANDAALPADKDPDWPHGWWSILPASALPALTQATVVDGYTQTGAAVNTSSTSTNAVLRIEVEGSSAGATVTGLAVTNGSSTVRGLVINRFTDHGLQSSGAVTGNFIGPDVSGTLDLGNAGSGVLGGNNMIIGGNTPALANVISGNDTHGIVFFNFNSSVVQGNYIGTAADGVSALGNSDTGVFLFGGSTVFNTIGGTASGEANIIAFNGNDGVSLPDAGIGNVIRGNSIHSNGTTASQMGIDLGPVNGLTVNDAAPDADTGPNSLQNFPVIQSAVVGSPNLISGTLSSVPNQTFTIDLYSNPVCDASGNGEGKTYLGSTTTTTDSSGLGGWRFAPATLSLTDQITATATNATNNTSEFSQCFTPRAFGAGQLQFASTAISDPEGNSGSHTVTFTVQRTGGSDRAASVNYTINDGSATIADNDYSVGSPTGTLQWANGDATNRTITITVNGDTKAEGDETVQIVLSSPVGATIAGPDTATLTITEDDLLLVDDDLVQCPTAAYNTIQSAINAAVAGQTVQVCAGTYPELVDVNKSLTVIGPNVSINPNTGVRVPEAVIIPTASDPLNNSFAGPIVVTLSASGVTFKGFTVDGNNPAFTSGVVFNGSDVDAEFGIYGDGSANMDAVIENNIVQNIGEIAIWLNTFGLGGARNANSRMNANKVDNVLGAFGQALRISDDCWADVTNNVVTRSRVGIVAENFSGAVTSHPASVIENNDVTTFRIGIRHNLHYVYGLPGFTIRNNTVKSYAQTPMPPQVTTPTTYEGIRVESIQQTVTVSITNNTVDGNRAALQTAGYTRVEGLGITNASATSPNISFTGNRVTENIRGVFHDTPAVPTFSCNNITGNATGIELSTNATNGLIANNNNIFGNGVGMLNNSPAGSINAESNYWGSATGPTISSNPAGTGDSITGTGALAVDYDPFLTSAAVCAPVAPPTISKAFGTVSVPPNGGTTLSFTLGNPNTSTLTGISFNDTFPSGLIVATPNGLTGSCGGGTITAADGSSSVSLSGATLSGGATCTFTVNVQVNTLGSKTNTTDNVTSTEGGVGGTASATLNVTPPSFSISDVTLAEGTGGTTNFVFTVTKTGDGAADVNFTTVDGSAQDDNPVSEDNDYTPNNGTLSFGVTEPSKTITVVVNADSAPELIENFTVVLSGPTGGATITDDTGLGTILNDDESVTTSQLTISEFRLSGPGSNPTEQANNEFIELYNGTDQPLFVTTTDGSAGWAVATSNGVEVFHIPNGTTIPARGHFLGTNTNGYSLNTYPAGDGTFATGDASWTTDVPDNSALAVFRTNNAANFNTTNRLDSVGPNTESNTLYREGAGYAPLAPADLAQNLEHTFFRQICVFQAGCPTPGRPRDTQDNAADFIFADTSGAPTSAGQRLGSPGPENLTSPIKRDPSVNLVLLDATVSDASAPNRDRNTTSDSANASLFGTMTIRRRVVNQTGGTVTRLRFRVIDMTTLPSGPVADLRLRSSSDQTGIAVNDSATCTATGTPSGSPPPLCTVTVKGLTLEQPPNVPAANGGGLNSTVTLPLLGGLPDGQSINVNFLLGVQKTGQFRFYLVIEALP